MDSIQTQHQPDQRSFQSNDDAYLSPRDACVELCPSKPFSVETLEKWRRLEIGPRYIKMGGRVLYKKQWLREYQEACTRDTKQSRTLAR